MNILIKNGRLIDPANKIDSITDLYISNGHIASINTAPEGFVADQLIDASDKIVCPGLIDICAHAREPGPSQKGSIKTESMAAVAGGITTMITPPTTNPIIDTPAVAKLIKDRCTEAGKLTIHPMGALTKALEGEQLAPMHALASSGCIAFTNSRNAIANSLVLTRCLEYAATHDFLVVFQAQDAALAQGGCMHDDSTCTRLGLNGIPESAETVEVARCLLLTEQTGVRAHFGQLSCERSVRMIAEAQERGLPVTADVSIQNLLLTDENVNGFNNNFHLIPPLRSQLDRAGLIQGLISGTIQAICSDHQPHERAAKEAPFADTEPGMIGLETLLSLSLWLVEQEMLDLPQLIEKLTLAPAAILGLDAGNLAIGRKADICIFDPKAEWRLTPETSYSRGKNTPFMGHQLKGKVTNTLHNGQVVYSAN
ncbi:MULTISPECIES: dihydroorotase [unclassified Neptuniibacter]|jgi:dihydroorotase|uniref:dihydroorotase n=1 Tax=unclassified Neptuniibacter TaxID=2630693 RepID=UPI0026E41B29|nr:MULTISPECIES: dihydroorotase [unclassified Neptuniibacter]MDO6515014.1 dihydroorotase [Neptuniibacter sp. 2_MG-2023]MDO6594227.1 dihydroorotase [Neptuniibacter sp. 1_MG-2023]